MAGGHTPGDPNDVATFLASPGRDPRVGRDARGHLTEEPVWLTTSLDALKRNPPRFGALAGLADYQPYDWRGPQVPERRISGIWLHD